MKRMFLGTLVFIFLLAACNNAKEEEINLLDPIEVQLAMKTEIKVAEELVTEAVVTQNGEPVSDASEVVFEIWQHGEPDTYQFEEAVNIGNGAYEVTWIARGEGVYYIFYHVTARGMHRMEKHDFIIGDVDVDEILSTPDDRPQKHMH